MYKAFSKNTLRKVLEKDIYDANPKLGKAFSKKWSTTLAKHMKNEKDNFTHCSNIPYGLTIPLGSGVSTVYLNMDTILNYIRDNELKDIELPTSLFHALPTLNGQEEQFIWYKEMPTIPNIQETPIITLNFQDNKRFVIDGNHRISAAKIHGLPTIHAYTLQEDTILYKNSPYFLNKYSELLFQFYREQVHASDNTVSKTNS